jgi:uncharacterized LabA/DUF88 family protein
MTDVCYLIDGFNLYHSLSDAADDLGVTTKWLDIKSLCQSYLPSIVGQGATLKSIYYFSALAKHRESIDPGVTKRHRVLLKCLEDTGIVIELSRFKPKTVKCPKCKKYYVKHEEKETDVSIALKLFEVFMTNECDVAIIVTGDTDLAPAFRSAQNLFPTKKILFGFPYRRKNKELAQLAPDSFRIRAKQYIRYQFADPHIMINGIQVNKPNSW